MLEVNQSFGDIEIDVPRDPDKIKFIISSETPLDEKSTCDSYLFIACAKHRRQGGIYRKRKERRIIGKKFRQLI